MFVAWAYDYAQIINPFKKGVHFSSKSRKDQSIMITYLMVAKVEGSC